MFPRRPNHHSSYHSYNDHHSSDTSQASELPAICPPGDRAVIVGDRLAPPSMQGHSQHILHDEERFKKRLSRKWKTQYNNSQNTAHDEKKQKQRNLEIYLPSSSSLPLPYPLCQVIVVEAASQETCPITTKLVLDEDEETKETFVQVHRNLVTKLKPHQVDGENKVFLSCCVFVLLIHCCFSFRKAHRIAFLCMKCAI